MKNYQRQLQVDDGCLMVEGQAAVRELLESAPTFTLMESSPGRR